MTHWVSPLGAQITEFAGHTDDCGPCANEVCLAIVQGRSPTTAHMNAIRARDLAAGIFRNGGGQNTYELVTDVQKFEPSVRVVQTPATIEFDNPTPAQFEQVHQALKGAMTRGNPCVINVGNAAALPGNERGVQWHFVACFGIDDALGYLIANGDEAPFDGVPNWVTWAHLLAAKPVAVVEYLKLASGGTAMDADWSNWTKQGDGMICKTAAPDGSHPLVRGGILAMLQRNPAIRLPGDYPIAEITAPDANGYYHQRFSLCEYIYLDDQHCGPYAAGQALTNTEQQRDAALAQAHVIPDAIELAPGHTYFVKGN